MSSEKTSTTVWIKKSNLEKLRIEAQQHKRSPSYIVDEILDMRYGETGKLERANANAEKTQ